MTIAHIPLDLATLRLAQGSHAAAHDAMCVMEATAYLAGESWSDRPACVSPVITAFCIVWNDALADPPRTELLKPFIPKIIGTNTGVTDDQTRAWLATDWIVRVQAPAWLYMAGLDEAAESLRCLPPLTNVKIARNVQSVIDKARRDAFATRDAAYAGWRGAVSARAASGAAARAAGGDAARIAARVATWDAERIAAWDAVDAAREAAFEAAFDAAWDAARAAARQKLAPTVEVLQASACDLLTKMIAVGR